MKKLSIVSVSVIGATTAMVLSASSAFAATYVAKAVQAAVGNSSNANVNVGINAATSTGTGITAGIVATTTSYNSDANINSNTNSNTNTSASINIGSDQPELNAYAQSIAANDQSVSAVSTTDNNVSISYKFPAKLFGFIPVNETETASVDTSASGTPQVSVHRSWWSFLASANGGFDEQTFTSALNTQLGSSAAAASQGNIMADIETAARASATASGSASTSGQAGY